MIRQRQQARHINDASSYIHLGGRQWVRRVARSMVALLVAQSVLAAVPAYAQATASSSAPAGQRPIFDAAQNGVPIVHVAPPSRAGVSRNQYDQFNVNQNGLILNNSPTNVQTQQGGWISGNPQLGPTPARIILNEVVGPNSSQLRGTIEVAGRRADIVVANPNGITCDGCGFLNADRATLTTGRPQLASDGSIQSFDVRQGQLTVGGNGLNATNLEQLDLLARGIVIEGEVWAKNLNAIAGANQVLYGTLQAAAQSGGGTAPRFAIDIKDVGGMYANQVYLVATEQGLGVNSTGRVAALQGNLVLSVNGDLGLQDTYARQNIEIQKAHNVQLAGVTQSEGATSIAATGILKNQGELDASGKLELNAAGINNEGIVAQRSAEGASLNAAGEINNSGTVYSGGQLKAESKSLVNSGSLLAGGDIAVRTGAISNTGASTIAAGANVDIAGSGLNNDGSSITAGGDIRLALGNGALSNQSGAIEAGRALTISAGELDSRSGRLAANDAVSLSAKGIDISDAAVTAGNLVTIVSAGTITNARGHIASSRNVDIAATALNNNAGVVSAGELARVDLGTGQLDNTEGQLIGTQALSLRSGEIRNAAGTIAADAELTLDTHGEALDNNGGLIVSSSNVRINSARMTNNGGTVASIDGSVSIHTGGQDLTSEGGKLQAKDSVQLTTGAFSNRNGLVSANRITTDTGAFNNDGGQVIANESLGISSKALSNDRGLLHATGNVSVDTQGENLANTNTANNGGIAAGGQLSVAAGNIDNKAGFIASNGSQAMTVTGNIDNGNAGTIVSNADSSMAAAGIVNNGGRINALGDLTVNAGTLDNRAGQVAANGNTSLNVATLDNRAENGVAGTIEATNLTASAQSINNTAGTIRAANDATLTVGALDNTDGAVTATRNLTVVAPSLVNSGGRLIADTHLTVTTASRSPGGTLASANDAELTVNGDFSNVGSVSAGRNLTVNAANIDNSGTLTAGDTLTANTGNLVNSGEISAQATNLNATGTLTNNASGLIDGVYTNINAATTRNTGRIFGDILRIQGDTVDNRDTGAIAARDTLLIGAKSIYNSNGGLIYNLGDLYVAGSLDANGMPVGEAQGLVNSSARIEAAGNMGLAVGTLYNYNAGLTTRIDTRTEAVNRTLIQPNGSPHKFDIAELGWDPDFKDGSGRFVAPSSTYPFGQFGTVQKPLSVQINCPGESDCTETHFYPPEHPIWSLFGVAPPYFSDLAKPVLPSDSGQYRNCMDQIGDGGIDRINFGSCGGYWTAFDAYNKAIADRTRAAEATLDFRINAFNADVESRSFGEWNEFQIASRTISETVIDRNDPAQILAGGQLTIAGSGSKTNDNSRIVAGGAVVVSGSQVQNLGVQGTHSVTESGQVRFRRVEHHGGFCDCFEVELSPWTPTTGAPQIETKQINNFAYVQFGGNETANRNLTVQVLAPSALKAAVVQPGSGMALTARAALIEAQLPASTVLTAFNGAPLNAPSNSLFKLHPEPNARYVVETDPRFTNYRTFLSSDYLLQALNRDPERQLKRYGDGFYEQQMVNDQILALTGRRYLSGYTDTETEYQALMDSGVAFGKQYQLTPGVALTAEQMALLTTDIVWLTTQTVVLPDGTTQQVLVPQVYLRRPRDGDLQTAGGLIAGSDVYIEASKDLINSGNIAGNSSTVLKAGNDLINEGGRIQGQAIYARAGNDLKNLSGVIRGTGDNSQVDLAAGRDIVLQTRTIESQSVASSTTAASKRISVDRIATVQGGDVRLNAGRDLTGEGSAVKAEADLVATAGRNIKVTSVTGSYELDVQTGGKTQRAGLLSMEARITGVSNDRTGYIKEENTTNQVATFEAGNNVKLIAGNSGEGDLTVKGVDIAAGHNARLQGKNVTIEAAKDRQLIDVQNARKNAYTRTLRDEETLAGGNIVAGDKLTVFADGTSADSGNATINGAYLSSKNGEVGIAANNDVLIGTITTQHLAIDESYSRNKGALSTKTTERSSTSTMQRAQGSAISGNSVAIAAGNAQNKTGDLTIQGSNVVADGDITLAAGNSVNLITAEQTFEQSASESKSTSGLFGGGGASITYGDRKTDQQQTTTSVTNVGSSVGSLKGKVSINAGNQYTQIGSQLNALEGDIDVTAQRIDINAATDTSKNVHETQFEQSGLTLAVSSPLISAMQTMQQMGEASSKTDDPRMRAMAAATAGMAAKGAADAAQSGNGGGLSISITVGKSESESKQTVTTATAVGSTISAGNNVKLHATGDGENSSITVLGSDIKAGNEAFLKAEGDINLGAAQNTAEQHSTNSSNSAGVGLAITFGNGASFGFTANASAARGKADGKDEFYTNSHVDAGNKLTLESGGDTNLKGAVVSAKQVVGEIGGDLNIESLQDTSVFKSREQSISGSVTVGMGFSGSASASKSKVDADYASVTEQSGIRAGDGGFQINVKGNTDLKGGAIASSEQAVKDGKNRLETETLTQSDIENHDRYEASSISLSGAGSIGPSGGNKNEAPPKPDTQGPRLQTFQTGMNGATAGIGTESGSSAGTTRSGISGGAIVITDEKKQIARTGKNAGQTVAETNRDVVSGQSSGSVAKAWDGQKLKEEVKAEAQITQAFSPMVAKEIGTYADNKARAARANAKAAREAHDTAGETEFNAEAEKWAEGGAFRVALHTAAGGVVGGVGGAFGAGASAVAAREIDKLQDGAQKYLERAGMESDSAKAVAKGVAGATAAGIGAAAGGTAGGVVGLNVDVNNRQLHPDERKWAKENAAKYQQYLASQTGEKIPLEEAYQRLLSAGYAVVDDAAMKTGKSDETAKQFINAAAPTTLFAATAGDRAIPFLNGNADGSYTPEQQARFGSSKPGTQASAAVTKAMQYVGQTCSDCRAKYTAIDNAVASLQEARILYQDDAGSVKLIDEQIDQLKAAITKDELVRGMAGAIGDKDKGIAALLLGTPSRAVAGTGTAKLLERGTLTQAIKDVRTGLPSDPRRSGNVAVANIDIDGMPAKMAAHSDIDQAGKGVVGKGSGNFTAMELPNTQGIPVQRSTDSEYKILDNIADRLGNNPTAAGSIKIITERPACNSCLDVANQFRARYPNIDVQIYDNNGVLLTKSPKTTPYFNPDNVGKHK